MIFNSLRWGIQAWYGLILVAVLTGFGLTAYHVAYDGQLRRLDRELEGQLAALSRPGPPERPPENRQPGERPFPGDWRRNSFEAAFLSRLRETIEQFGAGVDGRTNTYYAVVWDAQGAVVAHSAGAPADVPAPALLQTSPIPADPEPGAEEPPRMRMVAPQPPQARSRGEVREVFRHEFFGHSLLVGRSLEPEMAAMRHLALWLLAAGSGVLALGLAGGWWVATRAIRPIEAISAAATKISSGDLTQRIPATNTQSELGRLVEVLNSTFARLETAFAQQVRFTADASHELRTPVAVVISQTQSALARERSPEEYRQSLEACHRAAQRMRNLTQSLLHLARLDGRQEPVQKKPCDLADIARECADLVQPLAVEHAVTVHRDLNAAACFGDPDRLAQVATNLLTNAIQFNRHGGEIRVSTRTENGVAMLSVHDTGIGIPAEDLPHVFERFYRVDKSRSRGQGHVGLGLAISKAIADAHGGTFELTSEPGQGSTFTLKLPTRR